MKVHGSWFAVCCAASLLAAAGWSGCAAVPPPPAREETVELRPAELSPEERNLLAVAAQPGLVLFDYEGNGKLQSAVITVEVYQDGKKTAQPSASFAIKGRKGRFAVSMYRAGDSSRKWDFRVQSGDPREPALGSSVLEIPKPEFDRNSYTLYPLNQPVSARTGEDVLFAAVPFKPFQEGDPVYDVPYFAEHPEAVGDCSGVYLLKCRFEKRSLSASAADSTAEEGAAN